MQILTSKQITHSHTQHPTLIMKSSNSSSSPPQIPYRSIPPKTKSTITMPLGLKEAKREKKENPLF
jgi:hypothetical protein